MYYYFLISVLSFVIKIGKISKIKRYRFKSVFFIYEHALWPFGIEG